MTRSRTNNSNKSNENAIIVPMFLPPDNGTTASHVTSLDNKSNDPSIKLSTHMEAVIAHLKTWNESTPRLPGKVALIS